LKMFAGLGASGSSEGSVRWEKVASLVQLMKQVPSINSALKRGVDADAERFKQLQQQAARNSAALAAIAQTVMADTHELKNPADIGKWYRYCADMRDAAGGVNAAVHAGNQEAATAAMTRLAKSCESCHEVFRKEKE
jgi:cytochrome c556